MDDDASADLPAGWERVTAVQTVGPPLYRVLRAGNEPIVVYDMEVWVRDRWVTLDLAQTRAYDVLQLLGPSLKRD